MPSSQQVKGTAGLYSSQQGKMRAKIPFLAKQENKTLAVSG
jgi:hypothetical protein